jgi:hypothetical protein
VEANQQLAVAVDRREGIGVTAAIEEQKKAEKVSGTFFGSATGAGRGFEAQATHASIAPVFVTERSAVIDACTIQKRFLIQKRFRTPFLPTGKRWQEPVLGRPRWSVVSRTPFLSGRSAPPTSFRTASV